MHQSIFARVVEMHFVIAVIVVVIVVSVQWRQIMPPAVAHVVTRSISHWPQR